MNPVEDARRSLDQPRKAIMLLRRFPGLLGRDPEAAYVLGVAHFRLREYEPAERAFRHAIRLDPTRARAFYYLGLTMERRARETEALNAYQGRAFTWAAYCAR